MTLSDHRFGTLLRVGWEYNPYIGIELRASKSLENNGFTETRHYGIYLKPQYPMTYKINIYGLIGYGKTVVDYDSGTRSSHNSDNSLSFGGGFWYDLLSEKKEYAEHWRVWIDLQSLLRNKSWMHTDATTVSLGLSYTF